MQSYCLCTKSARLYLARENTVSWDIHTEKYTGQCYFLSLLFSDLWKPLNRCLFCIIVLAIFLILKNCQVSVIFCDCLSLNSGSRSIATYFFHCVLAIFLILKNCHAGQCFFCHCFSLNSGSRSIAVYFVIKWCLGHPCFLHQVFFHWHSLARFCTRFLHQVFFLWHSQAWFCTRFKLWKWNCSAIWHNLSSFRSNLHKIAVQSYCLCTKSERLYLARENTVSWDIHTEKYTGQCYFLSLLFSELCKPLNCCLFCIIVLAIFLILKNCQVGDIFCHCFSLNSGSRSIAVYFVWLCPGNFSNLEKLPAQCYFLSLLFSE